MAKRVKTMWDVEKDSLAELWQQKPCLFDVSSSCYHNCTKDKSCKDIAAELQLPARDTLLKYRHRLDKDPNINKFYKNLVKVLTECAAVGSHKTQSSHTVKVHKIWTGKNTFGADEALLNQLNCEELQVEMMDQQGCDIIIIFCPINTRVGSDVESAMSQVPGDEQVILILMHHTQDVNYSTAAKRWSETFENVFFNVSVLYHKTVRITEVSEKHGGNQ